MQAEPSYSVEQSSQAAAQLPFSPSQQWHFTLTDHRAGVCTSSTNTLLQFGTSPTQLCVGPANKAANLQ